MSDRAESVERFLAAHGWEAPTRQTLAGDASGRRFVRLSSDGRTAVLMDAPDAAYRTPEFIAVAGLLRGLGLSAPKILAADADSGLVLMEDFGDRRIGAMLDAGEEIESVLAGATDVLIALHRRFDASDPAAVWLLRFTPELFIDQAALFVDQWPAHAGRRLNRTARNAFANAWQAPLQRACDVPQSLLLRDYFADNLMWLADRQAVCRFGLLDFQDAGIGPVTYDLASLIDDARRDIPSAAAVACIARYAEAFPQIDRTHLEESVNVLAALRHVRVIAVFLRLAGQGREGYIDHLPRVWRLLHRRLAHPALAGVREWFAAYVPEAG